MKRISLFKKLQRFWVFIIATMMVLLIIFAVAEHYLEYYFELERSRVLIIQEKKTLIKQVVDSTLKTIENRKVMFGEAVKNRIHLYCVNKRANIEVAYRNLNSTSSKAQILNIIKHTTPPRKGYSFFVIDNTTGDILLDQTLGQSTEGRMTLTKYLSKNIAETFAAGEIHEGALGSISDPYMIHMCHFKIMNWTMGVAADMQYLMEDLKQDILTQIGSIRFGESEDNYIFVVNFDGVTLMNDTQRELIGKNIWKMSDPEGVKVIQEERKAAEKPDGGFISYTWEKPTTGKLTDKITFVRGIRDWEWMVGTGVYLDSLQSEIALLKHSIMKKTVFKLLVFLVLIGLFSAGLLVLLKKVNKAFSKDMQIFNDLLNRAILNTTPLNLRDVRFSEFDKITDSTNQLIVEKSISENRLNTLLNASDDEAYLTDLEGNILFYNKAAERNTNISEMSDSMSIFAFGSNSQTTKRRAKFRKIIDTEKSESWDEISGNNVYLVSGHPIFNEHNTVHQVAFYVKDLTAHKQMELELKTKAEHLQVTFDYAPYIKIVLDENTRIININKKGLEFFKINKESAEGALFGNVFKCVNSTNGTGCGFNDNCRTCQIRHIIDDTVELQESCFNHPVSMFMVKGDSKLEYHFLVSASPIQENDSRHILLSLIDVTDQVHAEREKQQIEDQLRHSQKMEAMGTLAGGVAHDFNNLLAVMTGLNELNMIELNDSSVLNRCSQIQDAIERATSLTQQLLAFSRKQTVSLKVIDVNKEIEIFWKMLKRIAGEDIALIKKEDDTPSIIKADPGQFQQVIMNIIINAAHAIRHNKKDSKRLIQVTLTTEHQGTAYCPTCKKTVYPEDYIKLEISDTGHGIPDDLKDKIFDPFFTTKKSGEGTGLGLSMVFGIVEKSGGHIFVDSTVGEGTTFTIYWPKASESQVSQTQKSSPDMVSHSDLNTVLIIEDEEQLLNITSKVLEKAGYIVLCAPTGEKGVELIHSYKGEVHLLFTDVILPGMDGTECAKKYMERFPDGKVLFASGYTYDRLKSVDFEKIPYTFIEKPYNVSQVTQTISRMLSDA